MFQAIEKTGIRRDDYRLQKFLEQVDIHGEHKKLGYNRDSVNLDKEVFIK